MYNLDFRKMVVDYFVQSNKKSYREVGLKFDICPDTVRNWCREFGVAKVVNDAGEKSVRTLRDELVEIRFALSNKDLSLEEISKLNERLKNVKYAFVRQKMDDNLIEDKKR